MYRAFMTTASPVAVRECHVTGT